MRSQSEIVRGKLFMKPQNVAKEICVEPIYQYNDDFYQRTVNQYNKPYYKLLKRYGNNQWIPQTIYIMIEKRNNEHIEKTIKQYTQQMKELQDSTSNYPIRNFTDAEATKFYEMKHAIKQIQEQTKYNKYGQCGVKIEVNCILYYV